MSDREGALSEVPTIRGDAERMVRNLCGSDRFLSANMTLVFLDEIERLRAENEWMRQGAIRCKGLTGPMLDAALSEIAYGPPPAGSDAT